MEDIKSKQQTNYTQKEKELGIALIRSSVVKSQITKSYETLENIRFDFLGDTAFRGKVVRARKALESAMYDFLLDENYWRKKIKEHREITAKEYDESIN